MIVGSSQSTVHTVASAAYFLFLACLHACLCSAHIWCWQEVVQYLQAGWQQCYDVGLCVLLNCTQPQAVKQAGRLTKKACTRTASSTRRPGSSRRP